MSIYDEEIIIDITDKTKELLGDWVKHAAIRGPTCGRLDIQDDLIAK